MGFILFALDGQFDLLADRAFYDGKADREARDLRLKGGGKEWDISFGASATYKSAPPTSAR